MLQLLQQQSVNWPHGKPVLTGLDISFHAIDNLLHNLPDCKGVVASADALPFKESSFDVIFSQFGAEYASVNSFVQALPLLKRGGVLAALIHCRESDIYLSSEQACISLGQFEAHQLLAQSSLALSSAIEFASQRTSAEEFRRADEAFAPVVKQLEAIIRECRQKDLTRLLIRFHTDLAHIYRRPGYHDLASVVQWLDSVKMEFKAYRARMLAVVEAALNRDELNGIGQQIEQAGLELCQCAPLVLNGFNFGWQLIARKAN